MEVGEGAKLDYLLAVIKRFLDIYMYNMHSFRWQRALQLI